MSKTFYPFQTSGAAALESLGDDHYYDEADGRQFNLFDAMLTEPPAEDMDDETLCGLLDVDNAGGDYHAPLDVLVEAAARGFVVR